MANECAGMQSVWSFGDAADILGRFPDPYVSGYLEFGGDAYGNTTFDPIVNRYFPENPKGRAKKCKNWDGGLKSRKRLYQYQTSTGKGRSV